MNSSCPLIEAVDYPITLLPGDPTPGIDSIPESKFGRMRIDQKSYPMWRSAFVEARNGCICWEPPSFARLAALLEALLEAMTSMVRWLDFKSCVNRILYNQYFQKSYLLCAGQYRSSTPSRPPVFRCVPQRHRTF
jgi:hypothetical protein